MKKVLFLLVSFNVVFSCSTNSDNIESFQDLESFPQKWQLERMFGQTPNSMTEGVDMEWQEAYILNDDKTFIKSRERNDIISEVSGTFVFKESVEGTFLILTHESVNELIDNCYSNSLVEVLRVTSNSDMKGTSNYCDGPGLEYKRIE